MFKTQELPGGCAPLAPLPGLCPGPTGGLKWSQTPRPIILHPPFLIPGYGPETVFENYQNLSVLSTIQDFDSMSTQQICRCIDVGIMFFHVVIRVYRY